MAPPGASATSICEQPRNEKAMQDITCLIKWKDLQKLVHDSDVVYSANIP